MQLINQERENITKINSPPVENTLNLQSKHSLNENISLQENPIHLHKSIEQVKPDLERNEITMGASNKPQNEPYGNELKSSEFKFNDHQNKEESSNQYLESIPTHFNNKQPISDQQAYVDYETPQQDDQYYEDYNKNNNIFQTDQTNIENQAFEKYPKFQEYDSQIDYQQEVPQNNQEYINYPQGEQIYDPNLDQQMYYPQETNYTDGGQYYEQYDNNGTGQQQNYDQEYVEPKEGEIISEHHQTPFQETTTFPEVDNSGHYQNLVEHNQTPEVYSSLIPTGQNEQLREEISSTSNQNEFQGNFDHISEFEEVNNPSANENYLEISQPAPEYKDRIEENQYLTDDIKNNPLEKENLRQINNTVNEKVDKKSELVTNLEANFQDETDTVTESSSDFWDLGGVQKQSTNNTTILDSNQDKGNKLFLVKQKYNFLNFTMKILFYFQRKRKKHFKKKK